ncbi:SusC/RagA family TonB-linked outer membrane protein [Mucilaginibacter boryungensis]|uniref:SusC/RagA family TonB-linked outer membrane protein n=1 Tax=Mucilaginibacter boryungensis TaxID=768480 RepID=A0ABR9XLZ7_9SPHI|nr:SusC/RagA family TonB-linked outer membrane protein [Mucilaginibacter boryungensis]MBE9668408.1 SusC/RagA family TonB-linked outer membrane protein [Mucilaginibacter boryungensis]
MKRRFIYLMLLTCCLAICKAHGQSNTFAVSGTVTDGARNETLPGVSVSVKGTTIGVTTDVNGKYSIKAPSPDVTLVFSFVGFDAQEVPLKGRAQLNITMAATSQALTEVVVVGYSQQTRDKNTAAVSKLDTKQLVNTANPSPLAAIQGKIAGVSIPLSNGQPGAAPVNVIIRGGSKTNVYGQGTGNANGNPYLNSDGSSPLVVIDGVFRTLNDLNPDDIESLQVMKDAASTAIYGARGANGVIVVKTKSGKFGSGKANITFNYRTNREVPTGKQNYMSAAQYLTLARTTIQNTSDQLNKSDFLTNAAFSAGYKIFTQKGQYGISTYTTALLSNIVAVEGQAYVDNLLAHGYQTMTDPVNPANTLLFYDNNYQNLLWNPVNTQNYNLGIDGGSQTTSYNVSFNYINEPGTFAGTKYKRYTGLTNFSFKASNNVQINTSVNYQNIMPNYVNGYTNDIVRATRITPLIRLFKDDGTPTTGENMTTRNRFHALAYDNFKISTERVVSKVDLDWNITKGLHFRPAVSYVMTDYSNQFNRKAFPDAIQFPTQRLKVDSTNTQRQLMIDQILQYDYTYKVDHHFMVLAGFNYTQNSSHYVDVSSQRGTNDYITTISEPPLTTVNGVTVTNIIAANYGTSSSLNKTASFFAQAGYDYKAKYLVNATIRRDGFSNFAPNNRYATFPSASVGWNIYKESFWKPNSPVSTLKLRGSWGQAGSSDLSYTDTYGGYSATVYDQLSGVQRANLANPNLKWETTQTTDVAIDAGFLNDRINLTVDFYNKLTKDRLDSKPLPAEAPFSSIIFNNGTLQNKGVEIELGATVLRMKDFQWRTNIAYAYNAQKIISLPYNGRLKNRQGGGVIADPVTGKDMEVGGFAEGERPYGYYAWQVVKVFSTDAEAAAWNATHKDLISTTAGLAVGKKAGDYQFQDVNNDGVIDSKDLVFQGYKTPDVTGGMQNTFTYKNFTMRFNMDFALGHVIGNGNLGRELGQGRAYNEGAPIEALGNDIWQKPGDEGKKYARFSFGDADIGQKNFIRQAASDVGTGSAYGADVSSLITKGDFLAFRELYLSYDLPKKIISRIKATGLTVFVSATNMGYATAYKGQNPETYVGFDPGGYPRPKIYTFGATLRF